MAKKLTAVVVAQAKAKAVRYEIADAGCPGLRLVVQESGAKSWLMRFMLVCEVTDDKSLLKAERKASQVDTAPNLSPGAKLIRLADTMCVRSN